jgi:outer membrane biosynthesis protein TonB
VLKEQLEQVPEEVEAAAPVSKVARQPREETNYRTASTTSSALVEPPAPTQGPQSTCRSVEQCGEAQWRHVQSAGLDSRGQTAQAC